ncbi:HesA/MoeB/ThiF family protein [Brevibacterium sp. XM4083]|uniref:HesA/MoeB/ThiF family protein n=1 Tax=Brevibacterium sp. XM4083 TaxID=2583238 RepID=UPI00112B6D0E|nr:HesA/MoeB/ThiF family protein [Brevibacterium sp. XM4083]MCM1012277.1 HesA/MoeB/ThiF family protein [Brevibacterium sp. XM4083]
MDLARYTRQIRLRGFGAQAQERLLASHVVVIGAGGLGAPVLTYLAAAGVGTISVIDPDVVELSNLHRQFLHAEEEVGNRKVDSAARRLAGLNSDIEIITHPVLLTADNAEELLTGADIVVDGSDNFETRYLVNDACEMLGIPLVWGTILGFDGQLAVFDARTGSTLRDLYPEMPAPGSVPNCATAGVIGALCGSIGSAMAMETVKVLASIGTPLFDAVSIHSSLEASWETIPVARDPERRPVTSLEAHRSGGVHGAAGDLSGATAANAPADEAIPVITWDDLTADDVLVDIRDDDEVAAGSVAGAAHIPMERLLAEPELLTAAAGAAVVGESARFALYCRSGVRSARTVSALRRAGIDAVSISGGYLAHLSRGGIDAAS